LGALLSGLFDPERPPGRLIAQWRERWVKPGRQFSLGLAVLAAWALSQSLPGLPSFNMANLREGLAPIWHTAQDSSTFDLLQWGRYTLYLSGLALLAKTVGHPGRPAVTAFFLFAAVVFAYKVAVVGRQLSLEALAGALSAMLLVPLWLALRLKTVASVAALFILGGLICAHFLPGPSTSQHLSNWAPLRGPIDHPVLGLGSVLEILWPPAAMGYLARIAASPESRRAIAWAGGAALAFFIFATDWHAKSVPMVTWFLMGATWTAFGSIFIDTAAAPVSRPGVLKKRMPSSLILAIAMFAVAIPALFYTGGSVSESGGSRLLFGAESSIKTASAAATVARDGEMVDARGQANAPGSDEFDLLAKAPNVIRALRGNEPGFVNNDPNKYWLSEGSMRGTKTRPVYDAKIGGLRFDIVPTPAGQGGANIAGTFYFNFGKHFGPSERFRVRWQQMFNQAMLSVNFRETAIKQAIIGSGDGPGLRHQGSCTAPDIVVTTYYAFRFAHLYHSCARYVGLYGAPRFNFQNMQPAVNGQYCNYDATTELAKRGNRVQPPPACAGWAHAMQWQDYGLEVENGPIDPVKGRQYVYSIVRLYVGKNADGTLHLAHEWDSRKHAERSWNGLGLWVGDAATNERFYGKFWGLPYMTGYKGGHTELMQTWYRHFIVTDETPARAAGRP
jgi:hypothetical protein